jgi:hypothetical protein
MSFVAALRELGVTRRFDARNAWFCSGAWAPPRAFAVLTVWLPERPVERVRR